MKNIKYSDNAKVVGFTDAKINYVDAQTKTPEELKNYIYSLANKHRTDYSPIFINNSKYLPVILTTSNIDVSAPVASPASVVETSKCDMVIKSILVGVGVFALLKIIGD